MINKGHTVVSPKKHYRRHEGVVEVLGGDPGEGGRGGVLRGVGPKKGGKFKKVCNEERF